MRSLVRTRRMRELEKRYLPEEQPDVRLIWGSEEDGSAYGIDLVGQGAERRSIPWRQDDETRPADMPPPPADYWERKAEEEEQWQAHVEYAAPEEAGEEGAAGAGYTDGGERWPARERG